MVLLHQPRGNCMKIRSPFCSFSKRVKLDAPNRVKEIQIVADSLRYHLRYMCPVNDVKYVEDFL